MIKNKKDVTGLKIRAAVMYLLFVVIGLAVMFVDVQPIGPENSVIGLAAINGRVRDFFGVNMLWYNITDVFGLVAIATAGCFGLLGLVQLIKVKSLKKVDVDIILLGLLYAAVIALYVIFEIVVINYRPILMEGVLEASFPSSHTMLVVAVMGSAAYQFSKRIYSPALRNGAVIISIAIGAVTVFGRLACGVHWFTDIAAGLALSLGLIFTYIAVCERGFRF